MANELKSLTLNGTKYESFVDKTARENGGGSGGNSSHSSPWSNKSFVAFGTSITWACQNYDGGFLEIVKNRNGFVSFENMGASGASMPSIRTKIRSTDISNYDLVLLECSTNDFKLNVSLGTVGLMGDTSFDTSTFCGAVRDSIEYILTNKPTMHILLITDTQRDNADYDVNYTNSAGHKLIDYVDALVDIGELYGIPVCDWYRESGFNAFTLSTYTIDGLHPNEVGYAVLGNLTASAVENMGCIFGANIEPVPDTELTSATYIGPSPSGIWETGEVVDIVTNPADLDIVSGYVFRGSTAISIEGPAIIQEKRACTLNTALCGNFHEKTISLSSNTLSDGTQIKFAIQYIALNEDGTFDWTPATANGTANCGEWISNSARIHGTYDTSKRHLLFLSFMTDVAITAEMCEEIKTLIRIS